jgi:hypothetical protein
MEDIKTAPSFTTIDNGTLYALHSREYASQSSLVKTSDLWPEEPQNLKSTPLSKWVNNVYDAGILLAPILLITKIGLVFVAHGIDKYTSGLVSSPPSPLTKNLIRFNNQVRRLCTGFQ